MDRVAADRVSKGAVDHHAGPRVGRLAVERDDVGLARGDAADDDLRDAGGEDDPAPGISERRQAVGLRSDAVSLKDAAGGGPADVDPRLHGRWLAVAGNEVTGPRCGASDLGVIASIKEDAGLVRGEGDRAGDVGSDVVALHRVCGGGDIAGRKGDAVVGVARDHVALRRPFLGGRAAERVVPYRNRSGVSIRSCTGCWPSVPPVNVWGVVGVAAVCVHPDDEIESGAVVALLGRPVELPVGGEEEASVGIRAVGDTEPKTWRIGRSDRPDRCRRQFRAVRPVVARDP